MDERQNYEIRIQGHLDARWGDWLGALTVTHTPDGVTILRGPLPDQTALHGVLVRIRDLNLPLLLVRRLPDSDF